MLGSRCSCLAFVLSVLIAASPTFAAEPEWPREQIEFFEKQIRPVLAAH